MSRVAVCAEILWEGVWSGLSPVSWCLTDAKQVLLRVLLQYFPKSIYGTISPCILSVLICIHWSNVVLWAVWLQFLVGGSWEALQRFLPEDGHSFYSSVWYFRRAKAMNLNLKRIQKQSPNWSSTCMTTERAKTPAFQPWWRELFNSW